jgi:hypothetical protein
MRFRLRLRLRRSRGTPVRKLAAARKLGWRRVRLPAPGAARAVRPAVEVLIRLLMEFPDGLW